MSHATKKLQNLNVNVFSTKVKLLIEDSIFTFSTGDGSAILRDHDHPSHAKVYGLCIIKEEPLIVTFNSQLF